MKQPDKVRGVWLAGAALQQLELVPPGAAAAPPSPLLATHTHPQLLLCAKTTTSRTPG